MSKQKIIAGKCKVVFEPMTETVKIIAACRDTSELRWEMAIDTDDRDRNYAADYEECMASYDAAIESLEDAYEGYIVEARGHLEDAKSLEASAGDAQDAIRALEALANLDPEMTHHGEYKEGK